MHTPRPSSPEKSSEQPYFLADKSATPTDFGTPPDTYVGRGAPPPLNSQIPLWSFGRYNGYPQKDTIDLRDPMTLLTQYYKQPQLSCATSGKTLYCCFPGEIMCEACEFDFSHFFYLIYLLFSPIFPPFFPRRKFSYLPPFPSTLILSSERRREKHWEQETRKTT